MASSSKALYVMLFGKMEAVSGKVVKCGRSSASKIPAYPGDLQQPCISTPHTLGGTATSYLFYPFIILLSLP